MERKDVRGETMKFIVAYKHIVHIISLCNNILTVAVVVSPLRLIANIILHLYQLVRHKQQAP